MEKRTVIDRIKQAQNTGVKVDTGSGQERNNPRPGGPAQKKGHGLGSDTDESRRTPGQEVARSKGLKRHLKAARKRGEI